MHIYTKIPVHLLIQVLKPPSPPYACTDMVWRWQTDITCQCYNIGVPFFFFFFLFCSFLFFFLEKIHNSNVFQKFVWLLVSVVTVHCLRRVHYYAVILKCCLSSKTKSRFTLVDLYGVYIRIFLNNNEFIYNLQKFAKLF